MRCLGPLLALCVAAWSVAAGASTITYTISGTMNGTLNSVPFSNEVFTFTTVADTANITYDPNSYPGSPWTIPAYFAAGTTTFSFAGGSGTFNGAGVTYGAFSADYSPISAGTTAAGIGQISTTSGRSVAAPLYTLTPIGYFYDLQSDVVLTGPGVSYDDGGVPYDTTAGVLEFTYADAVSGNATFTATLSSSPVPEIDPAGMGSVMALVGGAFGLVERRRRGRA